MWQNWLHRNGANLSVMRPQTYMADPDPYLRCEAPEAAAALNTVTGVLEATPAEVATAGLYMATKSPLLGFWTPLQDTWISGRSTR